LNRIESFVDLSRLAALREHTGPLQAGHDGIVTVAVEYDPGGRVTRSWFVLLEPITDGQSLPATVPSHSVVGTDLQAGEPTPAPIPKVAHGVSQEVLLRVRRERMELHAERERHILYSKEWHRKDSQIAEQAKQIRQLQAELAQADERNREFADRAAGLDSQLQAVESDLEALRQARSITTKAKELWASIRRD
jgi:hypothetical protein